MKQLSANVVRVFRYTTWVENVVLVPKKDGKTRVCVDYRDLNKASPKDNFPFPNIHILVDNCPNHEIQSFVDCYAGYHQILMDEDDAENTAFTTPWGTYCYRVMPFILKNVGETYMRAMTIIFHNIMHKEIEVYVDDVIIKSMTQADHVCDLKRFFKRLRRIKDYLSKPLVPVLPEPGRPLFLYLSVMDNSFGCVLAQHDAIGKKEQVAQKLRHYVLAYTTYLISIMDPWKYIFQKPMSIGRLAKWQILLTEFDIVYVTRTAMKAQALANHLAENLVDDEYRPLSTYFPNEEVNSIEEVVPDDHPAWKMYFDGDVNIKGVGIGAILISPIRHHYPAMTRLWFFCNMVEYEACIMGLKMVIHLDVHELLVMGDYDLLIRQAQGE
ncbi:uncharacterized protein [Nicotiana sylvestris]|uniref:uncharacterized protein n=1 Tax=Nicotiana sylvestris TaxID=4096 RepID=UPI00388CBE89